MAADSQRLDAVRMLTKARRRALVGDGISGRLDVMRRTPGYRRHSGNVRASPVPGYRPVLRTHRKALCPQPKQPERSSILAPTPAPAGTAPNSTHWSNWTGKAKGYLE